MNATRGRLPASSALFRFDALPADPLIAVMLRFRFRRTLRRTVGGKFKPVPSTFFLKTPPLASLAWRRLRRRSSSPSRGGAVLGD